LSERWRDRRCRGIGRSNSRRDGSPIARTQTLYARGGVEKLVVALAGIDKNHGGDADAQGCVACLAERQRDNTGTFVGRRLAVRSINTMLSLARR
jgi:hypothetical protein